ncbi:MAG: hemolysin III family protein, partial [Caulobacteraceae bacterium]|nr:hemolysin III family protein [Caulobacteraceae bacterium]
YPTRGAKLADGWVHGVGIAAAVIGGAVLLILALLGHGGAGLMAATAVYDVCLVAMLVLSAAYNLTRIHAGRPFLRKLDEAGIFLMIAGSYTPFTTQRFSGGWAVSMTLLVWAVALAGVAGKLFTTRIPERVWTLVYVAFGWIVLLAIKPLVSGVPMTTLVLLVIGGLTYTSGALVFHSRLPYRRAIWHGFVVAAAGMHYAAICTGVVLAAPLGA